MHEMRTCDRGSCGVVGLCLSVCLFITRLRPANTAKRIEVPFAVETLGLFGTKFVLCLDPVQGPYWLLSVGVRQYGDHLRNPPFIYKLQNFGCGCRCAVKKQTTFTL